MHESFKGLDLYGCYENQYRLLLLKLDEFMSKFKESTIRVVELGIGFNITMYTCISRMAAKYNLSLEYLGVDPNPYAIKSLSSLKSKYLIESRDSPRFIKAYGGDLVSDDSWWKTKANKNKFDVAVFIAPCFVFPQFNTMIKNAMVYLKNDHLMLGYCLDEDELELMEKLAKSDNRINFFGALQFESPPVYFKPIDSITLFSANANKSINNTPASFNEKRSDMFSIKN
jgi:hypothetical protein